jgi:hypothetical protein
LGPPVRWHDPLIVFIYFLPIGRILSLVYFISDPRNGERTIVLTVFGPPVARRFMSLSFLGHVW